MKRMTVILFQDAFEYESYASDICDRFSKLPEECEFLGAWCVEYNQEEAYSAISGVANHFIENTDKTEIILGISNKDYDNVIHKINTENCVVEVVNCKNL